MKGLSAAAVVTGAEKRDQFVSLDSEIPNKQQAGFWGSPFQTAALVSTGCASPRVLGTGAVASGAVLAARTVTTATTGVGVVGAAPAGSGGAGAGGSNSPGSAQPQPLPSQRPAGALGEAVGESDGVFQGRGSSWMGEEDANGLDAPPPHQESLIGGAEAETSAGWTLRGRSSVGGGRQSRGPAQLEAQRGSGGARRLALTWEESDDVDAELDALLGPDGEYDSDDDDDNSTKNSAKKKQVGRPLKYNGDPNAPHLTEAERRRIKRRIANRESARRVRQKRNEYMDELQAKCTLVTQHNARLAAHASAVEAQNRALTAQVLLLRERYSMKVSENVQLYRMLAHAKIEGMQAPGGSSHPLLPTCSVPPFPLPRTLDISDSLAVQDGSSVHLPPANTSDGNAGCGGGTGSHTPSSPGSWAHALAQQAQQATAMEQQALQAPQVHQAQQVPVVEQQAQQAQQVPVMEQQAQQGPIMEQQARQGTWREAPPAAPYPFPLPADRTPAHTPVAVTLAPVPRLALQPMQLTTQAPPPAIHPPPATTDPGPSAPHAEPPPFPAIPSSSVPSSPPALALALALSAAPSLGIGSTPFGSLPFPLPLSPRGSPPSLEPPPLGQGGQAHAGLGTAPSLPFSDLFAGGGLGALSPRQVHAVPAAGHTSAGGGGGAAGSGGGGSAVGPAVAPVPGFPHAAGGEEFPMQTPFSLVTGQL